MPVLNVNGYGVADHTILVDSTGYAGGDSSQTSITIADIPDGFEIGYMDGGAPFNELDDIWGISIRIHGDLELDAFRRGIYQLAKELDPYLGITMKERDAR